MVHLLNDDLAATFADRASVVLETAKLVNTLSVLSVCLSNLDFKLAVADLGFLAVREESESSVRGEGEGGGCQLIMRPNFLEKSSSKKENEFPEKMDTSPAHHS